MRLTDQARNAQLASPGETTERGRLSSEAQACAEEILSGWKQVGRASRHRLETALKCVLSEPQGRGWIREQLAVAEPGLISRLAELYVWPCDDPDCRTASKLDADAMVPSWLRLAYLDLISTERRSDRAGAAYRFFLFQHLQDADEAQRLSQSAAEFVLRGRDADRDALTNAAYALSWNLHSEPLPEASLNVLFGIARDNLDDYSTSIFAVLTSAHPDLSWPLLIETFDGVDSKRQRIALRGLVAAYGHIQNVWQRLPSVRVEEELSRGIARSVLTSTDLIEDHTIKLNLIAICGQMGSEAAACHLLDTWASTAVGEEERGFIHRLTKLVAEGGDGDVLRKLLADVPWH